MYTEALEEEQFMAVNVVHTHSARAKLAGIGFSVYLGPGLLGAGWFWYHLKADGADEDSLVVV